MKMKNTLKIMGILTLFIAFSCSKSEENVPLQGSIENLVLTSTSDDELLTGNETLTFTVMGEDGTDYTNAATITVNEVEITGNTYVFENEGAYEVVANYLGATSNVLNFDVVAIDGIALLIDNAKVFKNQNVQFTAVNCGGEDVTSEASFYVDGTEINGNSFSSPTVGGFVVYAEYTVGGETFTTDEKSFEVFIPKRKVVVEDYTGTWCGYCPRVAGAIEDVEDATDDVAVIAIHKTSSSSPDPMHFDDIQILIDEYDIGGLPQARINRSVDWARPHPVTDVTSIAGEDTDITISIKSTLSGDNLVVNSNVMYENGSSEGDKVVVYLLESGILYDQTNYYDEDESSPYYGMGDPIPSFEHNHVLRKSMTAVLGDAIPSTPGFEAYNKSVSTTIPADYVKDNLSLVVMVVDAANTAKNAQVAKVGVEKVFE